jgi:hypothetical protein
VVTDQIELGLLEDEVLEEAVAPGVKELIGVTGGKDAEDASRHSLPGRLMRISWL